MRKRTAEQYRDEIVEAMRSNPHAQDFYAGKRGQQNHETDFQPNREEVKL